MYDNIDLRHLNLYNLRNQIALVSQEPILFNYSIRENIAYGLINIRQKQIEEAAKLANAHHFIMEMKNVCISISVYLLNDTYLLNSTNFNFHIESGL